jgi:hypothetical protein
MMMRRKITLRACAEIHQKCMAYINLVEYHRPSLIAVTY